MFAAFKSISEVRSHMDCDTRRIAIVKNGRFTEVYVNGCFKDIRHNSDLFPRTVQYVNSCPIELTGIETKIEHNRVEVVFP